MNSIKIFCEGITDQLFIADCLEVFWGVTTVRKPGKEKNKIDIAFGSNCEIIEIGGCSKLVNQIILDKLRDNSEEGGKNIVIFDADFAPNGIGMKTGTGNNGYLNAKQKLEDIRTNHGVDFEFYLWHNNSSDGEIENLLSQLIPQINMPIFDCINSHVTCLTCCGISDLNIADLKNQLSFYLHTLTSNSSLIKRDYKNKKCWEMDFAICNDLQNFKEFLDARLNS